MRSNLYILQSELTEHKKILTFFRELPVDLRKMIQTFHKSKRPVLACHECDKRYYQICCFHKWVPWCQYHHAFPVIEEGIYYLENQS